METIRRRSVDPIYSMCVQPSFIIGTNNADGTANFAPITWVSVTQESGDGYLLVISMSGTKMTKQNVLRTGIFSANLVSTDIICHKNDDCIQCGLNIIIKITDKVKKL